MARIYIGPINPGGGGGGVTPNPTSGIVPVNQSGLFVDSIIQSTDNNGNGTTVEFDDINQIIRFISNTSVILMDGLNDVINIDGTNGINLYGGVFINNHLGLPILRFLSNGASHPAIKINGGIMDIVNGNDTQFMPLRARTFDSQTDITSGNDVYITNNLVFLSKSIIRSTIDGLITLSNNNQTDFNRLNFGGATASFPALKRNGTVLQVRLANDSADADLTVRGLTASGSINATVELQIIGRSNLSSLVDSNFTLYNAGKTAFNLLQFGGISSSFPALKRSGTELQVRLADDSNFANIRAGILITEAPLTSVNTSLGFRVNNSATNIMLLNLTNGLNINLAGASQNVASAILQADSTTKGFLPPRMTQANRTAIVNPAIGLIVYQNDPGNEGLYVYKTSGWTLIV